MMSPAVKTIRTFYVLDFDRCIGDTAKFHHVLEEVVADLTPIGLHELNEAKRETELSGGSFNTEKYVSEKLAAIHSEISWGDIRDAMLRRAKTQDMLEPHAGDLLRILQERGEHFGILTHGGVLWQQAKIEGANLGHLPVIITSNRHKGEVLASWQNEDGMFVIPAALSGGQPLQAAELVLIDDKAVSFTDIPPGVRGYQVIWSHHEFLPSRAGQLPPSVETAHGMIGAIELLFGKDSVEAIDKV